VVIDPERAARCASCRAAVPPDAQLYTLRVELFASAEPPEFDDVDMLEDTEVEFQNLLAEMEAMTPKQAESEAAKVFERHEFTLCAKCRAALHTRLRAHGS
jgi:hypothetical protein